VWLDTYEVTVARFRAFVDAGMGIQSSPPALGAGAHPSIPGSGWQSAWDSSLAADTASLRTGLGCSAPYATFTSAAGANETRPINCVTWFEAFAFCAYDNARLPTEAEWNFAAAAGNQQRVYPWSEPASSATIGTEFASYWVNGIEQCMGDGLAGCTLEDLIPVGARAPGVGYFGQSELGGNVWEWVRDAFANPYDIVPCNDCAKLGTTGSNRVIRGGSFFGNASTLYASTRNPAGPTSRLYSIGFRCARDP